MDRSELIFVFVVIVQSKLTLNNTFMICRNYTYAPSIESASGQVLINFNPSISWKQVSRVIASTSHTLCRHFCMHELPSGNCEHDLPFHVREELVSPMSSTSNSFCFSSFFLFKFFLKKTCLGSAGKNRVGHEKP